MGFRGNTIIVFDVRAHVVENDVHGVKIFPFNIHAGTLHDNIAVVSAADVSRAFLFLTAEIVRDNVSTTLFSLKCPESKRSPLETGCSL